MMPQTCPGSVTSPGRVRSQRGLIALLVCLALSVGVSLGAQAATTWTVCASGCDYTSIKAAIAAPTTRDGDTLAIAAGTYTEAGITVNKSLALQGEAAATTIVQAAATRGTATDRVFTIASGVTATLQDLTIRYGRAIRGEGGGIRNDGTLTLTRSTVRGNKASYEGGGIRNDGTLTLTQSTIRGNTTSDGGGLINRGTLTLTQSTVHGNTASYGSGGLINWGTLIVAHSTVSDNAAFTGGGGLVNARGRLTLTHSMLSGNATSQGGGLYNEDTLTLINTTVSGNSATDSGGGLFNIYGTLTLTQSIVASNLLSRDCHHASSTVTSTGYNLDSDTSCQLTDPTDLPGTDPLLGPLQDNGGGTLTHALLPGSPAIDAIPSGAHGCGTTVFGDQRWRARPQPAGGACDIGAYEVEVPGQALGGWVSGFTPGTVVCQNVTTGQAVMLSDPVVPWDCEAAGLAVSAGDQVALRVRGPMQTGATDVRGAVVGMTPSRGSCTNLTTGQQVQFQHMAGATAASCGAAGLLVHPGETVQLRVQGDAEQAGAPIRAPSVHLRTDTPAQPRHGSPHVSCTAIWDPHRFRLPTGMA